MQQDHHQIIFEKSLGKCEDEFLQLHSDFVVNQVKTFQEAGEEWEYGVWIVYIRHIAERGCRVSSILLLLLGLRESREVEQS